MLHLEVFIYKLGQTIDKYKMSKRVELCYSGRL